MTSLGPIIALLPYIGNIGPAWFRRKVVDWTPSKAVHKLRDIVDVMHSTSIEIYQTKKAALEAGEDALMSQVANGKDIMTILCTCSNSIRFHPCNHLMLFAHVILVKANSQADEASRLPEEELLAQMK